MAVDVRSGTRSAMTIPMRLWTMRVSRQENRGSKPHTINVSQPSATRFVGQLQLRQLLLTTLMMHLAACTQADAPGTKQFKERTGGMAVTTSMVPVETALYEYVDDPDGQRNFVIKPVAPLRFAFPAAYYSFQNSVDGGPQSRIDIQFDPRTGKPLRTGPRPFEPGRKYSMAEVREILRYRVIISIASNILAAKFPLNPGSTSFPQDYQPSESDSPSRIIFRGSHLGYKFFGYVPSTFRKSTIPVVSTAWEINLDTQNIYAYPENYSISVFKLVECRMLNAACRGQLYYHGREVTVTFNKLEMESLDQIGRAAIALLDAYRIKLTALERS